MGAALGVFGIVKGAVVGAEAVVTSCSLLFSVSGIVTLLGFRKVPLQTLATASTVFFVVNLCAGILVTTLGHGVPMNVFVYLLWFFPLLVFNKLVNKPSTSHTLSRFVIVAPLVLIVGDIPRLLVLFPLGTFFLFLIFCLSYLCFGLMFDVVTRYREEYLVEQERIESLKLESEILESISDCFLSLDTGSRLVYLNDAACAEFGVQREAVLGKPLVYAVPEGFSHPMLACMVKVQGDTLDSTFEVAHPRQPQTYAMRCYPRGDGLSIYFHNITESVLANLELEKAHTSLREQAELLDKAQDAIFVVDLDYRITYWNKGAERLYGWKASEVLGKNPGDVFRYEDHAEMYQRAADILREGEWFGEIPQRHRNGNLLTVEAHVTLVKDGDNAPRSILSINTDITERKAAEAKVEHLAYYDGLTDLPNRQLLNERINLAILKASRKSTLCALLNIDMDDFKTFNATLGHVTGDAMLQEVARRLMACAGPDDTVARFSGDEFAVLLEGLSEDPDLATGQAREKGEEILESLRRPFKLGSFETEGTTSIGISLFPERTDAPGDPLRRANLAMYEAKAKGRNRMCFYHPEMQTQVASRAELLADLRRAVLHQRFELHYQPQVDRNGVVSSSEALLRWRHPQRGMVSPAEFIPLAEEAGLIVDLGRWVLETACRQLAEWAGNPLLEPLSVAVNVSVRQFLDANFVGLVLEVLKASGANPQRLKLEITESSVMEKVDEMIAKMTTLNQHGVLFSLDDFGTGYSSLSHLKRLPLSQLKIDRSFVNDVLTNPKDASIARTIINLGQQLHLAVIAEGVETEQQREFLEKEGCYAYQGYLFSPALTSERFAGFVAAQALPV